MAKPHKVKVPPGKSIRYARAEDVRKAADKIFKVHYDLLRRLAEYEKTEKKKAGA